MAYTGGGYVKKGNIVDGYILNYSSLPLASTNANKIYIVLNSQGTRWLPGSLGGTYYPKGFYMSDGTNWIYTSEFPNQATQIQADAGVLEDVFISPKTLENFYKWGTITGYTATAPSTLQFIILQSTHNLSSVHKVTVYDPSGNEVDVAVNVNFTTFDVTIDSNINLLNSKITII